MTSHLRLTVFIDYQNAYRCARDAFFPNPQSARDGHLRTMELGRLIENRDDPDGTPTAFPKCGCTQAAEPESRKFRYSKFEEQRSSLGRRPKPELSSIIGIMTC